MVFKLVRSAAKRRRLLNGSEMFPDIISGVRFEDGLRTNQGAEAYEARYRQRSIDNLRRRAKQYGFTLAPDVEA